MKINNRQQLLVVLVVAVGALLVIDKVVYSPLSNLWSSRSKRIAELRTRINEGDDLLRTETRIRERWDFMRTNTLPNNSSLAEQQVLQAFNRWEQESRVSVSSILPQWKQDGDAYQTLDCRVDASGNIATLSRFLYAIEKDPMALRLQFVELTARDNEGQQLTLGLQVSGLVLLPETQKR